MMELDSIKEKQSTEKIVDRERKAPKEKSDEHDPKPSGRTGNYLVTGNPDGLPILRDQTPLTKLAEIALAHLRSSPATIGDASSGGTLLAAGGSTGTNCGGGLLGLPHRSAAMEMM